MKALAKIYDWLATADAPQRADVIFVLAGRQCRKTFAAQLFEADLAEMLLLSVGRFEIRRFADLDLPLQLDLVRLAASTVPSERHYFVWLSKQEVKALLIPLYRLGTWSEILAFSSWLRGQKSIGTGTVVSSAFHLRRVRWCCRSLVPTQTKLNFVAVPGEEPNLNREQWWRNPTSRNLVLRELLKVILYRMLLWHRVARQAVVACYD